MLNEVSAPPAGGPSTSLSGEGGTELGGLECELQNSISQHRGGPLNVHCSMSATSSASCWLVFRMSLLTASKASAKEIMEFPELRMAFTLVGVSCFDSCSEGEIVRFTEPRIVFIGTDVSCFHSCSEGDEGGTFGVAAAMVLTTAAMTAGFESSLAAGQSSDKVRRACWAHP
jgi:hypothetical protein